MSFGFFLVGVDDFDENRCREVQNPSRGATAAKKNTGAECRVGVWEIRSSGGEKWNPAKNSSFLPSFVGEKMEGEARTIECLRGRLQAERSTSKAAREEADLMGEKLIELEKQLKMEMESRNRAEKKLKYATKKLESLKLSAILKQSCSPERSQGSTSSSTVSSGLVKQEEKQTPTSPKLSLGGCDADQKTMLAADAVLDAKDSEANCNSATNSVRSIKRDRQSSMGGDEPGREQDGKSDSGDLSLAIVPASNSSTSDLSLALVPASDNSESTLSLAIVPANMHQESKVCEPKFSNQCQFNNDIHDVLVALQHAKEQLQTSMERMAPQSRSYELCGVSQMSCLLGAGNR
ncbi:hypothetical protein ACLOJK_016580 [Asimina triloba]